MFGKIIKQGHEHVPCEERIRGLVLKFEMEHRCDRRSSKKCDDDGRKEHAEKLRRNEKERRVREYLYSRVIEE